MPNAMQNAMQNAMPPAMHIAGNEKGLTAQQRELIALAA